MSNFEYFGILWNTLYSLHLLHTLNAFDHLWKLLHDLHTFVYLCTNFNTFAYFEQLSVFFCHSCEYFAYFLLFFNVYIYFILHTILFIFRYLLFHLGVLHLKQKNPIYTIDRKSLFSSSRFESNKQVKFVIK